MPGVGYSPGAHQEFEGDGRMRPSAFYESVLDVMEELVTFTLLTRDVSGTQIGATATELDADARDAGTQKSNVKPRPECLSAVLLTPYRPAMLHCAERDGSHGRRFQEGDSVKLQGEVTAPTRG